jgi:NADPH:quinone reductase-like Zn-dependent oxidoreductase
MSTATKTVGTEKAYVLTGEFGIDKLSLQERPMPAVKADEVRIRVNAVSLNYRDLLVVKGLYSRKLPVPLVLCSDGAGEVVEVGETAKKFAVGDRVAVAFMPRWTAGPISPEAMRSALGGAIDGMLSEYVIMPEEGLVRVPEHLSYEEAATLPCAAVTAWNALISSGDLKAGDTILTMGTGGVSLFALQFGHMTGARVIITSSSDEKLARAKQMGADETINYRQNPEWEKIVLQMTDKVGVDHVVELGGAGTLEKSMKAVKAGGQISLIGVLAGGDGMANPLPVVMKNICMQGIYVGSRLMFEHMNSAISLHKLKPVVDKVFGFDQVREALQHMESGSHFGKIVIRL